MERINQSRDSYQQSKYRDLDLEERRQMEVHIDELGQVKVIGYPPKDLVQSIQATNGSLKSLKRGV